MSPATRRGCPPTRPPSTSAPPADPSRAAVTGTTGLDVFLSCRLPSAEKEGDATTDEQLVRKFDVRARVKQASRVEHQLPELSS